MSEKNNPVQRPGDGARAIDTIREQFITAAREYQLSEDWEDRDYSEEHMMLTSYMSGYAPNAPLGMAAEVIRELIKERRQIK